LALSGLGATLGPARGATADRIVGSAVCPTPYSGEKVANREIRVWHFVIENGY
jgi:hypothetical protein